MFLVPFCAPGLFSTLCTAFYALVGMLLRGGKTVEGREFLQDSKFQLLFTVILYVFRMFVNFHLSISFCCRCRSEIRVCGDFSLDSFCMSRCAIFCECFGKSLYGCNLLLTIQKNLFFLLPRDIGFSTNEGVISASVWRICRRFLKFTYVDMCVYGESPLTSCKRNIQKKAQNSFLVEHNPAGYFITIINN